MKYSPDIFHLAGPLIAELVIGISNAVRSGLHLTSGLGLDILHLILTQHGVQHCHIVTLLVGVLQQEWSKLQVRIPECEVFTLCINIFAGGPKAFVSLDIVWGYLKKNVET